MSRLPLLVLALSATALPAAAQTGGQHPDLRYLQAPAVPTNTIALSAPPQRAPFRLLAPVARYGAEDDPADLILGDILAVVPTPTGIAVLDDKYFRLRLFDADLRPRQQLGRSGQGPGEFSRRLLSMARDSAGNLYVADLQGVKLFAPGAEGYQYVRMLKREIGSRALCILGSALVVNKSSVGGTELLEVYDLEGRRLRSFGTMYQSPNPGLNTQYNDGLLVCDPRSGLILFAAESGFGEVRAYRVDGTPVWRTTIAGFLSNVVKDQEDGYSVERSAAGVHSVFSLTLVPRHGLLVQVAHRTPAVLEEGGWYSTLTSFLLDVESGRPTPLGTSLPGIRAADGNRVIVVGEDPVPNLAVHPIAP
ncbi:MAG: hypothetical protein SF070_16475 [Gemmatimonadota bacterium]|nr:hypothetical protein [Gemmatimonadota bacterium]